MVPQGQRRSRRGRISAKDFTMTRKPKVVLYPDSLRPPPALPDAEAVLSMGLRLSEQETMTIRMAMAIHTASKQPKLTWTGWRHIAVACAIGAEHAKKAAYGRSDSPLYRRVMTEFLRGTGFIFLNKDDRAAAVRMLPRWDEIDAWRTTLDRRRQQVLNNPREVWDAFVEHRRELGDPEAKPRPTAHGRRQFPSMLEQVTALMEQLEMANERIERAERESAYFAAMMQEVAKRAKMDDDDLAEIRNKVRAAHEAELEPDSAEE
jgi:hypothetical protein